MKTKTAVIIHGLGANKESNFYPWLKNELANLNYQVILEDLPNSEKPILNEWLDFFKFYRNLFDKNSIIIGHSLGGAFAPLLAQSLNNLLAMYLIAPANPFMDKGLSQNVNSIKNTWGKEAYDNLIQFIISPIDWKQMKQKIQNIEAFFSTNDEWIPLSSKEYFDKIGINTTVLENRNHFYDKELPELITKIKKL